MGHAACSSVQFDNVVGGDGDQNLWFVSGEIMKMQAKLANWSLCWRRSCEWWMVECVKSLVTVCGLGGCRLGEE